MGEILNISFGVPFLETLKDLISEKCSGDKIEIAKSHVLLPSRRSCRELRDIYLDGLPESGAVLLPRIHALGDVDVSEFAGDELPEVRQMLAELPPAMPEFSARLAAKKLMEEIYEKHFGKPPAPDFGGVVSYSLVSFLEEFETYEADFSDFPTLFEADISEHWQRLSSFIMDFTSGWQGLLQKKGVITAASQRKSLTDLMAEAWQKSPPEFHIFAAGSTGSIPATARLLRSISSMPKGHVVVEGLDNSSCDDIWQGIGRSHFQHGLRTLLETLSVKRNEIKNHCAETKSSKMISEVFSPPEFFIAQKTSQDLSNIIRIDADNLRQEATVISLLMREILEEENKTAALITHNRNLARQVSASLRKFGIEVDDTAGHQLLKSPQGNFLMLLGIFITDEFSPELFLSLLKHPLFSWGAENTAEIRAHARKIEIEYFRDMKCPSSLEELAQRAGGIAREFQKLLAKYFNTETRLADFSARLKSHMELAILLSGGNIFEKDEGENLRQQLENLVQQTAGELSISPAYYMEYLESFLEDKVFRPRYGGHPRLKILSPIEARLLSFDRVILGGLNDGSWPSLATPNPWASEFMRAKLHLPTAESRSGQGAHDFAAHICGKEVFLTRSEKEGGRPTTVSRFLARHSALKGESEEEKNAELKWKTLAESLNKPESVKAFSEPVPNPKVEARPSSIRVTDIETLMRDPYEFYAKNILGLEVLNGIAPEPDGSNFGSIVHKVLKRFSDNYESISDDKKEAFIYDEALAEMNAAKFPRKAYVLWLPRLRNIAQWIVKNEQAIRTDIEKVLSEVGGKSVFSVGEKEVEIRGRADRIEVYKNGGGAIVDYKTGSAIPTKAEVVSGVSSQLPVMAVMSCKGAFDGFSAKISSTQYWQITGRKHEKGKVADFEANDVEHSIAEEGIRKLLAAFLASEAPFAVSPLENLRKKYSDYEHLERCDEWE